MKGVSLDMRDRQVAALGTFEAFYEAEHQALYATLCLVTGDRAEADDVAQEAFLRAWLRWDRVRAAESPTRYLYRIALNVHRNRQRATRRAARRLVHRRDATDPIAESDSRSEIVRALRTLPPRGRSALVLTDLLGFSASEVGDALGIRPSTVRSLAARAREHLRRELGDSDG